MGKRLFATIASLGLLIGLIAGVVGAGTAAAETPPGSQSDLIFFPWVPNGETLNNSNTWYGSIVVQNIESVPINLQLGPTAGGVFPISAIVQPHAAYTFSAADLATQLGWSGNGGGVVAAATWVTSQLPSDICQSETGSLVFQRDDDVANLPAGMTKTADQDVLAALPLGAKVTELSWSGGSTTDFTQSGNEITWGATRPADKTNVTAVYTYALCTRGPQIGGVEKQAAPTNSGFLVSTDSSMSSVDGYTAIPDTDVAWGASSKFCQKANPTGVCNNLGSYFLGFPVGGFDGTSYLPIVQGNYSGWDTYIHLTNIDSSTPNGGGQITITYYSQGQGVGNTGSFVDQINLKAGQSTTINVANKAPAGFVGSAWITSQYGIVVSASRVKGTMALTNTNVPSVFATTSPDNGTVNNGSLGVAASCSAVNGTMCQMYAPLVYLDYNGWNTGFNIVNTSEFLNQVTINVVNRAGTSVGVFTAAIPAKGMQYVYIPASQDKGLGQSDFTAAILTANAPFNATVDEVKYSTGEAMSYNATATLAVNDNGTFNSAFFGNSLSLPLYQVGRVGSDSISHGDTSGINLFNPTGHSVSGVVNFYMSTGAAAGSTQIGGGTPFTLGSMGSALVAYAPSQANLTPGSQLSAVVTVTGGRGGIVGVSNEVNYDVNGDGGVVFNMLNLDGQYRYACSQTTCGSPVPPVGVFASKLTLSPSTQSHAINSDATVTATAYDANGNPQAGVPVTFTVGGSNAGTASPATGGPTFTGSNGEATFTYSNSVAGTDSVSATAPAPNGQTLASVPPTVNVVWTIPTLAVSPTPQTIYLSDNSIGNGTPSPSYTWTWTFQVSGYSNCADVPAISDSTVSGTGLNTPENFTFPAAAWTASGSDTCTTSLTMTSSSPENLMGNTQTLGWTLASTPSTTGNNTTMTWVAPTLNVQVCTISGGTCTSDNPNATPPNTETTVTADANNQGSWKYTFTVTGVPEADLANALLQANYQPGSVIPSSDNFSYGEPGSGASLTDGMSAWSCSGTAPVSCTATYTNTNVDLSSPVERVPGKEIINWYLDINHNGTQDGIDPSANDNPTTVIYVAPALSALGGSGNGTDWASPYNVPWNNGYSWEYQFTVSNVGDCSQLSTTVDWIGQSSTTTPSQSGETGSFTNLTWTSSGGGSCVTTTNLITTSDSAQFGGHGTTWRFSAHFNATPTSNISKNLTITWAAPPVVP